MSRSLENELIANFKLVFDVSPKGLISAPGRINLIGEHTDYTGGFVLPVAIDRSINLAFSPLKDDILRVHSIDFKETREVKLSNLSRTGNRWFDYVQGVAWAMKEGGQKIKGWQGMIVGDIPIGAGLSSSAALEMATVKAFCLASNINLSPTEMALIGKKAEVDWVGVNVGIMDQLISAAGKANHALFLDCKTLDYEYIMVPGEVAFVVLDTMTRRELANSAYNKRRSEVAEAESFLGATSLREASMMDLQIHENFMPLTVLKRARHVLTENDRVKKFVYAMRNNELNDMGKLINQSHASLRDDFEVSSRELNCIVEIAQDQPECLGARMTGAGFGGCALAMIRNGHSQNFINKVFDRYYVELGIKPKIYLTVPSNGASNIKPKN